MCLPLKCLQCWVTFAAVLTLILGVLAAIVAGVQMGGGNKYLPEDFQSMAGGATYAFLAFGILLILIGISGIIGSVKKNNCCLWIFRIGTLLFCLIFLILAIALFAAVGKIGNMRDVKQCEASSIYGAWERWDKVGYGTLCTADCRCQLYKDSPLIAALANKVPTGRKAAFAYEGVDRPANNTNASVTVRVNVSAGNNSAADEEDDTDLDPVRFQQCVQYDLINGGGLNQTVREEANGLRWTTVPPTNATKRFLQAANASAGVNASASAPAVPFQYSFNTTTNVNLATAFYGIQKQLETFFDCAGVCSKKDFYTYSDVNELPLPKDSCGGVLYDMISKLGKTIAVVSLIIGLILLLNIILACCLAKHKDNPDK